MASAEPTPAATLTRDQLSEKIDRSGKAIAQFLSHQQAWLAKGKNADKAGYHIEAIGICIPQIHAMLRRGLWIRSQLHSLEQHPEVWNDSYSFDLLMEPRHDMMEGVQDQQLYGAAMRFGVIGSETASRLHRLYEDSKITLRATFSLNKHEKPHPPIADISKEFLEMNEECLLDLQTDFASFEEKIQGLLERLGK